MGVTVPRKEINGGGIVEASTSLTEDDRIELDVLIVVERRKVHFQRVEFKPVRNFVGPTVAGVGLAKLTTDVGRGQGTFWRVRKT